MQFSDSRRETSIQENGDIVQSKTPVSYWNASEWLGVRCFLRFSPGIDADGLLKLYQALVRNLRLMARDVRLGDPVRLKNYLFLLSAAAGLVAGCETTKPTASVERFNEDNRADIIVRYFSDSTSYMIKPAKKDGAFRSPFTRQDVLGIAREQTGRELAVVVIDPYPNPKDMDVMRAKWRQSLAELGFRRLVILQSGVGMDAHNLPVMENISTVVPVASLAAQP